MPTKNRYTIRIPDGTLHQTTNLYKFARQHKTSGTELCRAIRHDCEYQGFYCVNIERIKAKSMLLWCQVEKAKALAEIRRDEREALASYIDCSQQGIWVDMDFD